MKRLLLVLSVALSSSACLEVWSVTGPYACSAEDTCPTGFACDDGLCCKPNGSPACLTVPVDNQCSDGSTPGAFFEDKDRDGAGNANITARFCRQPLRSPWVLDATDCDDTNPDIKPTATDGCDGKDNNCDGDLDEGQLRTTWYRDQDGDGFGDATQTVQACGQPVGFVDKAGDCAPNEVARFPGAPELCNNLDDNCNGQRDDAPVADVGEAFPCLTGRPGLCSDGRFACQLNTTTDTYERVCNSKLAPEVDLCDGLDNDCDGAADEQPSCGGPASLISTTGVRYGAQRFYPADFNALANRCNKDFAPSTVGPVGTQWSNPNWVFSTGRPGGTGTSNLQVWWVEAPPGEFWDLTAPNLSIELRGAIVGAINPPPATPDGMWGPDTRLRTPIVYLCGENGLTEFTRYVPKTKASPAAYVGSGLLQYNESTLNTVIPLGGTADGGTDWLIGRGSGFNIARVKRLEIVLWPDEPTASDATYTLQFLPQAGFKK